MYNSLAIIGNQDVIDVARKVQRVIILAGGCRSRQFGEPKE